TIRIAWYGDSAKQTVRPVASAPQQVQKPQLEERPGRQRTRSQLTSMSLTMRTPNSATECSTVFGVPVDPDVKLTRQTCAGSVKRGPTPSLPGRSPGNLSSVPSTSR